MLSKELLDILCCPKCRGALAYSDERQTLTCTSCAHVYMITDGIPIMIVDEKPTGNSVNG